MVRNSEEGIKLFTNYFVIGKIYDFPAQEKEGKGEE
jgi:hypothetical protein